MNKGSQIKTTAKYIDYLADVIKAHELEAPFYKVNWKDPVILAKYFTGNDKSATNRQYHYMISKMLKLDLLINENDFFLPKLKCRYYTLNVSKLHEFMHSATLPNYVRNHMYLLDLVDSLVLPVEINEDTTSLESFKEANEQLKIEHNDLADKFEQIDNKNVVNSEKIFFRKKESFTKEEKDLLKQYYQNRMTQHPIFKKLAEEIVKHNNSGTTNKISFQLRVNVDGDKRLALTPGGRQWNPMCQTTKDDRDRILKSKGFDAEWDIHGAIFTVTRALNKATFNTEWDIKRELISDYDTISKESRDSYKNMLMRMYFEPSMAKAWSDYNHSFDIKEETKVTKEGFETLYTNLYNEIGNNERFRHSIFMYESLLEVMVINRLHDMGCDVENVFDCFYFKSSQTSEDEVKKIVCESMKEIVDFYKEII